LDDENIGESRDHHLTPGLECSDLGRHQLEGTLHPRRARTVGGLDVEHWRQEADKVVGGRMLKANRSADQDRRRAAPAVAEDFVSVAGMFQFEFQDARHGDSRLAPDGVPIAMGHQSDISRMKPPSVFRVGLEQGSAGGHDVKPEVARHRRQVIPQGALSSERQ
jgi:hypothetical protein